MARFAYVAKTRTGEEVSGYLAGDTMDQVVMLLHNQGLAVLHVMEDRVAKQKHGLANRLAGLSFGRISVRDAALFNRQFATVLDAGIPLVRGLRGLAADTPSRVLTRSLLDVAERIERGETLSDAMAHNGQAFDGMYISMIRAGERSGTLPEIVEQMAVYLEKVDTIQTKIRSAMAYPMTVLVFAIVATLFLLLQIVPTFKEIYGEMGQSLPGLTQRVVDASDAVRANALLSFAVAAGLILVLVLWGRTKPGRYMKDAIALRLPVFGDLLMRSVMSRTSRTLGMLLRSGLPVLESLELVKGAAGNAVVEAAIDDAKAGVARGQSILESFRATRRFPEMVLQLMATGEESGDMDGMLIKASDFYDRQVEATVAGLTALLEPLMIVCVGGLIGVIVVAMFLPIFHLGEAIMRGGYNL
jgi:type IV pilus assembly protein PilC